MLLCLSEEIFLFLPPILGTNAYICGLKESREYKNGKDMYLKSVLMAGLLGVSSGLMAQSVVQLGDLEVSKIWQEYGSAFVQDSVMELQARNVAKVSDSSG